MGSITMPKHEKSNSSKFNYLIVLLLFLGWILGGMDRMVMNFAVVPITKEFGLSATQTGFVISSFLVGYLLMQIPGGLLADKFGPRKVLLVIITIWSFFTGLTGIAWSLMSLAVIRFSFGLGEGSFFSSATKMISISYPKAQRGKALSLVLVSSGIVAILAPIFAAKMIAALGWRNLFFIVGGCGLIIVALYYLFLRSDQNVEAAEEVEGKKEKVTYGQMLKVPMMWNLLIGNFGCYTLVWGLNAWMPSYLVKVAHVDLVSAGWLMSIPGIGALVGLLGSGFIIDKMTPAQSKGTAAIGSLVGAIFLYMMYKGVSVPMIILSNTIVSLITGYLSIYLPGMLLKNLPKELMGSATGFTNFGGQCGSFLAPIVMGIIVDTTGGSFGAAFWYLFAVAITIFMACSTMNTNTTKYFLEQ